MILKRLSIFLSGRIQLCLDRQSEVNLDGGKVGALIAYLAIENGRPHSRQTLAALLWPDRSDAEALSSLRFALSKLHAALQDRRAETPYLLVTRSTVQFNPQVDIWVDVVEFQKQAEGYLTPAVSGMLPSVEKLQDSLDLYPGIFLENCLFADSLEYETWALGKRETFDQLRIRLLKLQAASLEAQGGYRRAAEILQSLIREEPWDEDVYRGVMRVLYASGQRGAALNQYESCRRVLAELGLEPGKETNSLAYRIKSETVSSGLESLDELPGNSLIAREQELQRLDGFLQRALTGQGQVVLIRGEPGSGKTALMCGCLSQSFASHPDLLVVGGQCNAYAGLGQPYQPFIECLQMLSGRWRPLPWADRLPDEAQVRLQEALPDVAQALLEWAPSFIGRFINRDELLHTLQARSIRQLPPDWQKKLIKSKPDGALSPDPGMVMEQGYRFLTCISVRRPLIILLDDLQWADPASVSLFFYLARNLVSRKILMIGAYRPLEVIEGTPLAGCLAEIQRYGGNIRLDLDRKNEAAFVSDLMEKAPEFLPNDFPLDFKKALSRKTAGNPLFTIELINQMRERGDMYRDDHGIWQCRPNLNWNDLPSRVEAAIALQFQRLPANWQDWMATAAVEGENFTAEVIAKVHGLDQRSLLKELDGPIGAGQGAQGMLVGEGLTWVHAGGNIRSLSHYRFRHSLIQTYIYQQMSQVERSRRHAAVGQALEELFSGQPALLDQEAASLARHFENGGLLIRSATACLHAGKRALILTSNTAAVEYFQHGIDLLSRLPQTEERQRLEIRLYLALSAPFLLANNWGSQERQRTIQKALAMIQVSSLDTEDAWSEFFMAVCYQIDNLTSQGEHQQAKELGLQLQAHTKAKDNRLFQAIAERHLGFLSIQEGNLSQALHYFEDSIRLHQALGCPDTLPIIGADLESYVQSSEGFLLAITGCPDQGWLLISRVLERLRSVSHLPSKGVASIYALEVAVLRGDSKTIRLISADMQVSGEGVPFFRAFALASGGLACFLEGLAPGSPEAKIQLQRMTDGYHLWESLGMWTAASVWVNWMGMAYLLSGEIQTGLDFISRKLPQLNAAMMRVDLAMVYLMQGLLFTQAAPPDWQAAETSFMHSLEISRQQGAHWYTMLAATRLGLLWKADRSAAAFQMLEQACLAVMDGKELPAYLAAQELLRELGQKQVDSLENLPLEIHEKQ